MERKKMPDLCGDTVGNRQAGLLADQWLTTYSGGFFIFTHQMKTSGEKVRNAPSRSPLLFGHSPQCLHYLSSVDRRFQRVANVLSVQFKDL
jgi:hypothetical protein